MSWLPGVGVEARVTVIVFAVMPNPVADCTMTGSAGGGVGEIGTPPGPTMYCCQSGASD